MTDSLQFPNQRVEDFHVRAGEQYRQQMGQTQRFIEQSGLTPEQMLAYQQQAPNAGPGTMASGAVAGVPPEAYAQMAQRDPGHDTFQWYDPTDWISEGIEQTTNVLSDVGSGLYEQVLKPLVRGAFAVTEGLSQELVQRPLSALAAGLGQADQDVSVREAYNRYGTSALFQALGNVVGEDEPDEVGKGFDLGTGFFTGGAGQLQAEEARRLTVQGQTANMGRLYMDQTLSSMGLSPGDRVYDLATGISQFAFDVFLDPSILLTAGTGGLARAAGRGAGGVSRIFGAGDELVQFTDEAGEVIREVSRSQILRENVAEALTIDGIGTRLREARRFGEVQGQVDDISVRLRQQLFPEDFDESGRIIRERSVDDIAERMSSRLEGEDAGELRSLLNESVGLIEGPNGRSAMFDALTSFSRKDGVLDAIARADETALVDSFKAGRDNSVPLDFIAELGGASTKEEVAGILNEAISRGHLKNRNFYGGFGSMVRKRLPDPVVEKIDKFSGLAARGFLDANDRDVAAAKLDTFARQAGLGREDRNEIFRRLGQMEDGDYAGLFEVATDVYSKAADSLRGVDPDVADNLIKDLTAAYGTELENLRVFNLDELGEIAPGATVRTTKKHGPDGVEEVLVPTPHLLSEFNGMQVPIPDIDDVRRAATKSDTLRQVYQSAGWEKMNRSLRFVTRSLFKPLVLLRPAYIARTQIDDQLRMWAAGVDGVVSNPRHLIQMAAKAPDELRRLAEADPAMAKYTERILNQSILDVDNSGMARSMRERIFTPLRKPAIAPDDDVATKANDFITAWRHELGQLHNDEVAHYLINNNLDIDDAMAAILGRSIDNPKQVEALEVRQQILGEMETRLGTASTEDLEQVSDRAFQMLSDDITPERIQTQLSQIRDGRSLDTLVHPATGETIGQRADEFVRGPADDAPPAPGDFDDPTVADFDIPDVDEDEAVTLEEFLGGVREEMERAPDAFDGLTPSRDDFLRKRTEYMLRALLEDADVPADEVGRLASSLNKEIDNWVNSQGGKMHTLRERSELLNLVRQTGKAQRRLHRGERMRVAQFNQMMAEGRFEPGQIIRANRMQSATANADRADEFASFPMSESAPREGDGVQILYQYADDVRAQNIAPFNPGEAEYLMPEQQMRIRSVKRVKDDPDAVTPHGEERYIIEVEGTPSEGVTGKVMQEGPQGWMRDLNRAGTYDGSPQSLAGGAWNDLTPDEQREYEQINEQIDRLLNGSDEEQSLLQYYSELRHLVDNARRCPMRSTSRPTT